MHRGRRSLQREVFCFKHINLTGDYVWRANKRVAKGGCRPLKAQDSLSQMFYLLRGVAGYRLRWLHPFVVELPANVLASFPELIHALPQAPRQVRQLFRPEEDENDEEYDKKIRTTQIPNPKCKNIHYHSKLVQPMVYSRETQ